VATVTQFLFALRGEKSLCPFILETTQRAEDLTLVCHEDFSAFLSEALAQSLRFRDDKLMRLH
jgi:hypothetical protein